jgi:hypothetical protein
VVIENEYEYDISTEPVDLHKINIDLTGLDFKQQIVYFVIETEDSLENISTSEAFDFDLPFEPQYKKAQIFLHFVYLVLQFFFCHIRIMSRTDIQIISV